MIRSISFDFVLFDLFQRGQRSLGEFILHDMEQLLDIPGVAVFHDDVLNQVHVKNWHFQGKKIEKMELHEVF
jgi:hypothetical protein